MKPSFFIIGAPKCGTTALAHYLAQHENVFFSSPKEPSYFARHLWLDRIRPELPPYRTDLDAYLALFAEADPERHRAVGEGSTIYLCSRTALQELHAFQPEAQIIVMLRNPVDLAYALFSEQRYNLQEDQEDFETAWNLQETRRGGARIPKGALRAVALQYGARASLGAQMEAVLEIFPRDRVMWIFMDDFKADTAGQYRRTLDALGLPDDGRTDFPAINTNRNIAPSPALRVIKHNRGLRRVSTALKQRLGVRSWGIAARLQKRSGERTARPELSPEFRARLTESFTADIRRLEALTGRDLSAWRQPG